jgi:hypothetical protein
MGKGVHVYERVTWVIHGCLIVEQVLLFFIDSRMHWENPMLVYFFQIQQRRSFATQAVCSLSQEKYSS